MRTPSAGERSSPALPSTPAPATTNSPVLRFDESLLLCRLNPQRRRACSPTVFELRKRASLPVITCCPEGVNLKPDTFFSLCEDRKNSDVFERPSICVWASGLRITEAATDPTARVYAIGEGCLSWWRLFCSGLTSLAT